MMSVRRGSIFLRIGNFLYFAKTNLCDFQKVPSILSIDNIFVYYTAMSQLINYYYYFVYVQ